MTIGRTFTVLTVGPGEGQGALTALNARCTRPRTETALACAGPARFEESTRNHIEQVILPLVDRILSRLGVPCAGYEISVANLGAAAITDSGVLIGGYSADIAVFLTLLSAALDLSVIDDLVVTGHIASTHGDLRPVQGLPAKLRAAAASERIRKFLYPALHADDSLSRLAPAGKRRIEDALADARRRLLPVPVVGLAEVMRHACGGEEIVLAALRHGYYTTGASVPGDANGVEGIVQSLTADLPARFWAALGARLLAGEREPARRLLDAFVQFHTAQGVYPSGMGARLLQIVGSLPPAVRRLGGLFPLLPIASYGRLVQHAAGAETRDTALLHDAITGPAAGRRTGREVESPEASAPDPTADGVGLDRFLAEIDGDSLGRRIGLPIDQARASYVLDRVIVDTPEEFNDIIAGFYLHLARHLTHVTADASPENAGPGANELLDHAFARQGGYSGALAEARHGVNGGLRRVLDAMTEQYKAEETEKHMRWAFRTAFDPLDDASKVRLMALLLARGAPLLPPELRRSPAEYAKNYEEIIRAYVRSCEYLARTLRSL